MRDSKRETRRKKTATSFFVFFFFSKSKNENEALLPHFQRFSSWNLELTMEQVSRSLYRAVLRFARHSNGVPFSLSASEARAAVPLLLLERGEEEERGGKSPTPDEAGKIENLDVLRRRLDSALEAHASSSCWDSSSLVRKVARIAAEAGRETDTISPEREKKKRREEALDAAFRALQRLHGEHWRSVAAARASRAEHARSPSSSSSSSPDPKHRIGQVFVHKKFGYRAVIVGWDRGCAKGPEWARAVGASTARQPFYSCLPSEDDCVSLFGAARASKYVAEENVDVETLPAGGSRVTHPLLRSFFDGWREEEEEEEEEEEAGAKEGGGEEKSTSGGGGGGGGGGRYIGNARLRYEFPDDFGDGGEGELGGGEAGGACSPAAASAVEDDSNLLLSDGEREERRRRGRRRPRSSSGRAREGEEEEEAAATAASAPASSASPSGSTSAAAEPAAAAEGVER